MIAKHIPMRTLRKSDFAELTQYITDAQSKDHRLGAVALTNCASATLDAAIEEVVATQRLNTRATGDKTYHLIVSFRAGEQPSPDTLAVIEARICDGLGFAEHQRISAVHNDTDNLHIHIAINKVHPIRRTLHEPFQSYRTLAGLCQALEHEFGLAADNHTAHRRIAAGRAADMERHAGVESLVGWISRECLADLRGATSWDDMHRVLADNGLSLRERANGFVFEANGVMVKASTVARDLSRKQLEARLGPFDAAKERAAVPGRRYRKDPVRSRADTTALYARYRSEMQSLTAHRAKALAAAKAEFQAALTDLKLAGRVRRGVIKIVDAKGVGKRLLYQQAASAQRARIKSIHETYTAQRTALYEQHTRVTWADWLKREALNGDLNALAALRAREMATGLAGNTFGGGERASAALISLPVDTITKKGTIIYRTTAGAVRDDGERLQVSDGASSAALVAALRIAMARYGGRLNVAGTTDFQQQIVRVAVAARLNITFSDPALEQRRQQLTHWRDAHEHDGRRHRPGAGAAERGRAALNRVERTAAERRPATGVQRPHEYDKPGIGRLGRKPPAQSVHRLRRLSQLGMVRVTSGSEMLLPGDVPHHLVNQGASADHSMRRDGAGRVVDTAHAAAEKYIAEREQKRASGFDIAKHRRYDGTDRGDFAGLRMVDGQPLLLLKYEDAVLVMPIDEATAKRLQRVAIGTALTVTSAGIKTKGRRR